MLGGASIPTLSHKKDDNLPFALNAVGIPTSKPLQKIKNIDVASYEEGYDSYGEMGTFFDAVAGFDVGFPTALSVKGRLSSFLCDDVGIDAPPSTGGFS